MVSLNEIDSDAKDDHRHDDCGAYPLADARRNNACDQQDRDQGVREQPDDFAD
jgi:hypothetical protein